MSLTAILKSVNRGFLKDALGGAGIALATSGAILITINSMIDNLRDATTNMPPIALTFAHLAGIDVGLSIFCGALVAKYVHQSSNIVLQKKK